MNRNEALRITILIYVMIALLPMADAKNRRNLFSMLKHPLNVTSNVDQYEYDPKTLQTISKIYELIGSVLPEGVKHQQQEEKGDSKNDTNKVAKLNNEQHPVRFNRIAEDSKKYPELIPDELQLNPLSHRQVRQSHKASRRFCPRPHRPKKSYYSEARRQGSRLNRAKRKMMPSMPSLSMPDTDDTVTDDWQLSPLLTQPEAMQSDPMNIDVDSLRYRRNSRGRDFESNAVEGVSDSEVSELTESLHSNRHRLSSGTWRKKLKTQGKRMSSTNCRVRPNLFEEQIESDKEMDYEESKRLPEVLAGPLLDFGPLSVTGLNEANKNSRMLTPVPNIPRDPIVRDSGQQFNYDNPHKWFLINRQCAGHRQSPIALFTKGQPANLAPIAFQNYDVPLSLPVEVQNNGHTAEVPINTTIDGTRPTIFGGGLNDAYEAINIHFHWGSQTTKGSEHAIRGKKYNLEMHIVHKNRRFPTMREALEDPFGLVVLGILFKISKSSDGNSTGLHAVYDALPYISEYESMQFLNQTITMRSFLADLNTKQFYTYRGSLTTPPCAEAVTWFVFPDILSIENKDLEKFFTLNDERGRPLLNNFRPLQPSFLRRIYYRKGGQ